MNVILLTSIILIIAPGHWGQGVFYSDNSETVTMKREPCQTKSRNNDAYQIFSQRHIVRDRFDRNSMDAWKKYLNKTKLCGRAKVQSFIEAKYENNVKQICGRSGWRLKNKKLPGNLCISKDEIQVYNVNSTKRNGCKVTLVKDNSQYVVVACDNVKNACLPVHFQKYDKKQQQPDNKTCQKSA